MKKRQRSHNEWRGRRERELLGERESVMQRGGIVGEDFLNA